ncbi:hypothetical protein WZ342_2104 [Enterococcus faecalis]|nr:hypothetical protein WZ342_2104 [Enterococcus faecalis]
MGINCRRNYWRNCWRNFRKRRARWHYWKYYRGLFRKLGSITLVAFFRTSHRRFSNYLSVARSDYLYRYLLFYCKPQGVKLYQNDILKSIIKLVKVNQTITFDVFSLIF